MTKDLSRQARFRHSEGVVAKGRSLARLLFLRHLVWVEISILLVIVGIGLYLLASLFFNQPTMVTQTPSTATQLNIDALDILELWIEEQAAEEQTPLRLEKSRYFERVEPPV